MPPRGEQAEHDPYSPGMSSVSPIKNPVHQGASSPRIEALCPDGVLTNKRKPSSSNPASSDQSLLRVKRIRLGEGSSGGSRDVPESAIDRSRQLPAEIWHHILTFLHPKSLACLLSVNKLFFSFLHPHPPAHLFTPYPEPSPGVAVPLTPDGIWRRSRQRLARQVPRPLEGKTELDMWRLVCTRICQSCGSGTEELPPYAIGPRRRGLGLEGVAPVFPFGVALCGNCFFNKSLREADILSSSPISSVILSALPPVVITKEGHIIPGRGLRVGDSYLPHGWTRLFWPNQVEAITQEYEAVHTLGPAAAEEWMKGLTDRGHRTIADGARWENWNLTSSGVGFMRTSIYLGPGLGPSGKITVVNSDKPVEALKKPNPPGTQQQPDLGRASPGNSNSHAGRVPQINDSLNNQQQPSGQPTIPGLTAVTTANPGQLRLWALQKRSKQEVAELKSKRRAEIERRALLLQPPIPASVLARIPSFLAALQIISPLDDLAWELLRPRLVAQREEAELREREQIKPNTQISVEGSKAHDQATVTSQTVRKVSDKEWDEAQGPLRRRITDIADEVIRANWNGGKVKKKNVPQFAAEVLVKVRERFYAAVAKDATAATKAGSRPVQDPAQGPWTQRLTLENMKWLFDFKIKPCVNQARMELFLCNGCKGNSKHYSLESVVQHYAAKHTTNLSIGNVVVHWRAEWPEVPPFNPNPRNQNQSSSRSGQPSNTGLSLSGPQHCPSYSEFAFRPPPVEYGSYNYPSHVSPFPMSPSFDLNAQALWPSSAQPNSGQSGISPSYSSMPLYSNIQSVEHGGLPDPVPRGLYHDPDQDVRVQHNHQLLPSDLPNNSPLDTRFNVRTIANTARVLWDSIVAIGPIPTCVRAGMVVHCVAKDLRDIQGPVPYSGLPMFIEALSTDERPHSMQNITGLVCKACYTDRYASKSTDFSLPQLANHFYKFHKDDRDEKRFRKLDWRKDMILLPDRSIIRWLRRDLRYDPSNFNLAAKILGREFLDETEDEDEEEEEDGNEEPYSPSHQQFEQIYSNPGRRSPLRGVSFVRNSRNREPVRSFGSQNAQSGISEFVSERSAAQEPQHHPTMRALKSRALLQEPSQSRSYSLGSPNLVPTLIPASMVYKRQSRNDRRMEGRYSIEQSDRESFPSSQHGRSPATVSQGRRILSRDEEAGSYTYFGSSSDNHIAHNEEIFDYRDFEPHRYAYREQRLPEAIQPAGQQGENGWRRAKPPRPVLKAVSNHHADNSGADATYSHAFHLDEGHDEVIYADASGQKVRREFRPAEVLSRTTRLLHRDDQGTYIPFRPLSPYDEYPVRHHDEDLRPGYDSLAYQREPERGVHQLYYEDTHLPSQAAFGGGTFEFVKVRGPAGDYMARRLIVSE
ncbi:hypothetical protein BGZ63DRAFT_402344 [Mariannaea sp. PMI_226]|nr:hypothetical protein BGZ63DRAFT_402344 [Mariannaea sp. PMI_226]